MTLVATARKLTNNQLLASALLTLSGLKLRQGQFTDAKKDFNEGKLLLNTVENSFVKEQLQKLADTMYEQVFSKI